MVTTKLSSLCDAGHTRRIWFEGSQHCSSPGSARFVGESRRLDSAPTTDDRNLKMELLVRGFFHSASRRWFTHLCHITTMPSYKIDIAPAHPGDVVCHLVSFANRLHPKTIFDQSKCADLISGASLLT